MNHGMALTRINALHGNSIKALSACRGKVFAATDNGLYTLDDAGQTTHSTHDSRDEGSIASNIVWALKADKYGNLWAGTDNGLSLGLNDSFGRIIKLSTLTGNGTGNCLYDILREPDGTTWLGGSAGLIRYNSAQGAPWQGGRVAWFRQNSAATHLAHNRVRRIYRDRQGDILVCTDHGINLYDRRNGTFRNFIVTDRTGHYTTTWAYDIVQDDAGRYWISSYMGGVFIIDKARLLASDGRAVADRHIVYGLRSIHVGRIALNGNSRLWLQLNESGLDVIDTRTFSVTHELENQNCNVSFVMTDNLGDVWAAGSSFVAHYDTRGRGVHFYNLQDSPARRITAMCAVGNSVWAIAGQECMVFNRDGSSLRFAVPGGLTPLSICYDNSTKTVLLGGNDAIAVLAADVVGHSAVRRLFLSAITVNGKPFLPEGSAASRTDRIELSATQNNLTLKLTDIPYNGLRKSVYAYRLEGVDHAWQYLRDGSLSITYNALPHGNYTLKVCEVDGQGRPAAEVYALRVVVRPPLYLSVWAKLLYVAVAVGLCLWGFNFYMMHRRLSEEQRARRQIQEQSQARAVFYSALSRRLKSPLAKIMAQADRLLQNDKEYDGLTGVENIRRNSETLSRIVYETLDQTGAELKTQDEELGNEEAEKADSHNVLVADTRGNTPSGKPESDMLDSITAVIEKHMSDTDFNVTRLASEIGMGDKSLYRRIKQLTGHTPVEFIRQVRMQRASVLLREGRFSVSEVMYLVGFQNSSYFSKCFVKEYGIPPAEYSKKASL